MARRAGACANPIAPEQRAPTLVQPESRSALLTCLGRQMGAHPPAADEARRTPQGKRLERLCDGALAAPSHMHASSSSTEAVVAHIRFAVFDLRQMHQPAKFCHQSSAAPGAESGAQSTPTF